MDKQLSTITNEEIKELILLKQWDTLLHHLCHTNNNDLYINSSFFKHVCTSETYPVILQHILNNIDFLLSKSSTFSIHLNIKDLTFLDIEKNSSFIFDSAPVFKEKYPDKLFKMYIYNSSFIFSQFYKILSNILDKKTKEKIVCISV